MSAAARLLLGLTAEDEQAVEEALYGSPALRVLASGADAGELLELAAASPAELVLLSADLPGLDAPALARLRALGLRPVGLALDADAAARLAALDLDDVVRAPVHAAALLELLDAAPAGWSFEPAPSRRALPLPRQRAAREGSVVAVVGSRGAPGASELAVSFAALLARRHRVLLAELDGDGGRLALRLGVDPREGSLLAALRALRAGEANPAALLPHWLLEGRRGWPSVLPGLPDGAADLAEAPAAGLAAALLDLLAASFPLVVCDLGQRLAPGGERDLAVRLHREAALAADAVVALLGCRPDQLQAGLGQLDLLLGELCVAPELLRVVVNGQPGIRSPRLADADGALSRALAARGLAVDAWLPYDERALRASVRRRLPLASAAPRGGYARALAALAALVLLPSLPRPAARKRLLRPLPPDGRSSRGEEVALPWRRLNGSELRGSVERALAAEQVDLTSAAGRARAEALIEATLAELRAAELAGADAPQEGHLGELARELRDDLVGLGAIAEAMLADPDAQEWMINGPRRIFRDSGERIERVTAIAFADDRQLRAFLERLLEQVEGKRLDRLTPRIEARLPDGSRLTAAIPPVSSNGHPICSIRRFRLGLSSLGQLEQDGFLSGEAAAFLAACVRAGRNIVVSGRVSSGKTTLLNALGREIPADERVVVCESSAELQLPRLLPNCVGYEARPGSPDGLAPIRLEDLVADALRMNPDRIVVGECRGPETMALLWSLATGHAGMTSIHGDSAEHALRNLLRFALTSGARIEPEHAAEWISDIDLVVHCDRPRARGEHGRGYQPRRVDAIVELAGHEGARPTLNPLFAGAGAGLRWLGVAPRFAAELRDVGFEQPA